MKLKFYGSMLVAMMLGFMASCSSDVEQPGTVDKNANLKLAAEPSIRVWSGNEFFTRDGAGETEDATEEVPNVKYNQKEVEVNLAINDVHLNDERAQKYDVADLCSKLSIHLRSAQDVKVTIPVPASIYCDQDDLLILNDHSVYEYGGFPAHSLEMEVGGNKVTLTIKYNESNFVVSTDGMNEAVLAYCKANYGDGLNFEIYNYYNRANMHVIDPETKEEVGGPVDKTIAAWDTEKLKEELDKSTIEFLNGTTPDYYINAFTGHTTLEVQGLQYIDCYVTPVNATTDFETPYYDYHFNGFDQNIIYEKKVGSEDEGDDEEEGDEVEGDEETSTKDVANDNRFGVNKATKENRPNVPEYQEPSTGEDQGNGQDVPEDNDDETVDE